MDLLISRWIERNLWREYSITKDLNKQNDLDRATSFPETYLNYPKLWVGAVRKHIQNIIVNVWSISFNQPSAQIYPSGDANTPRVTEISVHLCACLLRKSTPYNTIAWYNEIERWVFQSIHPTWKLKRCCEINIAIMRLSLQRRFHALSKPLIDKRYTRNIWSNQTINKHKTYRFSYEKKSMNSHRKCNNKKHRKKMWQI